MDRLAPFKHGDEVLDLPLSTGWGLHVVGAEREGEAVLLGQPLQHGARRRAGVDRRLEVGREVYCYSTREELRATVKRAFFDETWRQSAIAMGRKRVVCEHRYQNRLSEILDDVRISLLNSERAAAGEEAALSTEVAPIESRVKGVV